MANLAAPPVCPTCSAPLSPAAGVQRLARVDCAKCGAVVIIRRGAVASAPAPTPFSAPVGPIGVSAEVPAQAESGGAGIWVVGAFAVCAIALLGVMFLAPQCRAPSLPSPAEEEARP